MMLILVMIFTLIALADVPALIKQKKWYEITVFSIFFLPAFVLAVLQSYGITIPSPIKGAEFIIKDLLHLTYS